MSRPVVNTHAGDDSDGRLWGIEGINILFILAGLLLSVGLSLMLFREQVQSPVFSFGVGSLPFVVACIYVFALRQGRPRSYDTDLLETLLSGRAWLPLHTLEESTRAQLRWSVGCDYREELLSYKRITDERCEADSWAAISRNERFNRYWHAMRSGRLRREKLELSSVAGPASSPGTRHSCRQPTMRKRTPSK